MNFQHSDMICCFVGHLICAVQLAAGASPTIALHGGLFNMGIEDTEGAPGEYPPYASGVKPFAIDKAPVTNENFLEFMHVKRAYIPEATSKGWSYVFRGHLTPHHIEHYMRRGLHANLDEPWWVPIVNATFRRPRGPGSAVDLLLEHPVVHVSKRDANAYCRWLGKRLPTEEEWEFAARGGLKAAEYPWGDSYEVGRTNLWQGDWTNYNDSGRDGWKGTNAVYSFPPQNRFGMYDLLGNVWEWTSSAWHEHYKPQSIRQDHFTLKGGSFIDSKRGHVGVKARTTTRTHRPYDYTAANVGFRCAENSFGARLHPTMNKLVHSEL